MIHIGAGLVVGLMILSLMLHIFGLPANWLVLGLVGLWKWLQPEADLSWMFMGILAGMALCGEVLEFLSQMWGAKKYGGSKKGNWGAILGAIAGSIFGAPFFFGLGALPGALLGAYGGCLGVELITGRTLPEARSAAKGALWGKMFGMVTKIALGGVMVWLSIPRVWG